MRKIRIVNTHTGRGFRTDNSCDSIISCAFLNEGNCSPDCAACEIRQCFDNRLPLDEVPRSYNGVVCNREGFIIGEVE